MEDKHTPLSLLRNEACFHIGFRFEVSVMLIKKVDTIYGDRHH